jgi:hypothetical protein
VVIQCKRPFKQGSVTRNLFDAGRQLRRDLTNHSNALTIVAVSFSRLFNSGNRIAVFTTESQMDSTLHQDLRRVADGLSGTLAQTKRHRVSAAFFHSGTPAFVSLLGQMTFRQLGAMIPVAANGSEITLLQEIAKLVKV